MKKPIKPSLNTSSKAVKTESKRKDSDENYVLNLCDEVLGKTGSRQHTFDFLRGDAGKNNEGRKL